MQVEAAGTVFMWEVIIRICLWILESVKKECEVSEEQAKILDGHQKPILLLDKKKTSEILCPSVAPGNPKVGVMLPYAPVQLLIFTLEGIKSYSGRGKMPEGLYHPIHTDEPFTLGDIDIHPFEISHDANEPAGYRLECGAKSVAVATDLGKYDSYTVKNLQNLDAVLLEANHDIHMLEVGGYPYYLKQRILGDRGHLSNELSGQLLCDILHDNLKYIMLGHLSRENNYASLLMRQ